MAEVMTEGHLDELNQDIAEAINNNELFMIFDFERLDWLAGVRGDFDTNILKGGVNQSSESYIDDSSFETGATHARSHFQESHYEPDEISAEGGTIYFPADLLLGDPLLEDQAIALRNVSMRYLLAPTASDITTNEAILSGLILTDDISELSPSLSDAINLYADIDLVDSGGADAISFGMIFQAQSVDLGLSCGSNQLCGSDVCVCKSGLSCQTGNPRTCQFQQ
jgi:hypothetical protein